MKIYDDVHSGLLARLDELEQEAQAIADEHWRYHYRENAGRAPREKARLNVWVRRRDRALEITWTSFKFLKAEGADKTTVRSTHIRKGSGHKYRSHSLAVRAKEWELDRALETEERMAQIRSEYAELSKIFSAIRRAKKKAASRGSVASKSEVAA